MKVVISLGSNLGDREENLESAVTELNKLVRVTHLSTFYETDPVGGPQQPDYLNAVLIAESELAPEELLEEVMAIEAGLGRVRLERFGPRTIDIVLEPWLEIDPEARIPGRGQVSALLAQLSDSE